MEPCNNCKSKKHCKVAKFIEDSIDKSPWKVNSYLHEHHMGIDLVSMMSGDLNSVKLECSDYKPVKPEADYSYLAKKYKPESSSCPPSKCGSCKGKCK